MRDDVPWECVWKVRLVFAFARCVPLYQMSLMVSVLQWLAARVTGPMIEQHDGVAALLWCIAVVPYRVLLEPAVVRLLTHHRVTSVVFFYKLRGVPFHTLVAEDIQGLMHAGRGRPEWDQFVWAVCFGPGVSVETHCMLLSGHPRCEDTRHWCHYMRLHAGLPYHDAPPTTEPLPRFLSRHAQPGDMARVLCQLTEDDPVCVRRWISVSLGYRDNDTNTTIIPWETMVCHVIGSVVLIAYKVGLTESLPGPVQTHVASLLLDMGYMPQFAAWLLRMLIFHADDEPLHVACHQWWWKYGPSVIPALYLLDPILSPCVLRLAERCNTISPHTGTELHEPLFFFRAPGNKQCIRLLVVLWSVLPKAVDTPPPVVVCNPGKFRTLFTNFALIHALIAQSVEAKHWNAVSYLIISGQMVKHIGVMIKYTGYGIKLNGPWFRY